MDEGLQDAREDMHRRIMKPSDFYKLAWL